MSLQESIQQHYNELNQSGTLLGDINGDVVDEGNGRGYQTYTLGNIYQSEFGACALYGAVLTKYEKNRDVLGYPLSDITFSEDGRYWKCSFEFGEIYERNGIASATHGDLYNYFLNSVDWEAIGAPTTDVISLSIGQAIYHEYGCIWASDREHLIFFYRFPKLGKPLLVNTDSQDLFEMNLFFEFHNDQSPESIKSVTDAHPELLSEILSNRFVLETVRKNESEKKEYTWLQPQSIFVQGNYLPLILENGGALAPRQLYNIGLLDQDNFFRNLAPHSVYTINNDACENFGLAHVTDTHVSRRIDAFRKQLIAAGVTAANAKLMINWNDCFRDFILFANKLHAEGKLDFIMLTGDLIDYVFERSDSLRESGGGNFAFFESIVLGQVPYPDEDILGSGRKQEELTVPMFVTLGNHDYRLTPYELLFTVNAAGGIVNRTVSEYGGFNLIRSEVERAFGIPELDGTAALKMVHVDETLASYKYFFKRFTDQTSYRIQIGQNQLLLLDTKWDNAMIEGQMDAFLTSVFGFNESKTHFASGSPDSIGFTDTEISLLKDALNNTLTGLTIIGMHAPPLNIYENDNAHYLRETEHAFYTKDNNLLIKHFLVKKGEPRYKDFDDIEFERAHPGWLLPSDAGYFKKGDTDDYLDYDVCFGQRDNFLQLCAGRNTRKKADLVLFGHVHRKLEFRIEWNSSANEMRYFTDFYTEFPLMNKYYPTRYIKQNGLRLFGGLMQVAETERIFTPVDFNTPVGNNIVTEKNDGIWQYRTMNIPMYKNPLSKTSDAQQWWNDHKPLLIQTPAMGPSANRRKDVNENKEEPSFNFQGFRLVSVQNNIITSIKFYNNFEFMKFNNNDV